MTVILRLPVVRTRTGLSKSSIYSLISSGQFPQPISLGARAVGWLQDEVEAWLVQRIQASRSRSAR
jgi:prophage regulatory protein